MEAKLGALIIHGMGVQERNFAKPLIEELKASISAHAKIRWHYIYWADLLSKRESKLLNKLFPEEKRPRWFGLREFVMNYIGDATAYRYIPTSSSKTRKTNKTYDIIHERVHNAIVKLRKKLGSADKPVIVMAHSLGSVIMPDYVWDRQNWDRSKKQCEDPYGKTPFERMETLAGFITFGSPIPIFTLAYTPVTSVKFPPKNLPDNLSKKARWLNFYGSDDVFGWPLKHLSKSYEARPIEEKQINVGGILTSWNPMCHFRYWTDNDFTRPVAQYISKILDVCP